jgi:hypothetical protein
MSFNEAHCDQNLRTPYVKLDPSSLPPPSTVGDPLPRALTDPTAIPRFPEDLGIPMIRSERVAGTERINLSNAALSVHVSIDKAKQATIVSLCDGLTGTEFLSSPACVFHLRGADDGSSDIYAVERWDAYQSPDCAELVIHFVRQAGSGPQTVIWHASLYRTRPQLDQEFEATVGDAIFGQVLPIVPSLSPLTPANLFGRGFAGGKPNIPDRRRFEIVPESEHLCYDSAKQIGLWAFVAEIGGQERIAKGQLALIQNPSFRTRRGGRLGPFVIQPFHGPVEIGFLQLRRFIQSRYSIQKDTPALYEWNQFWLWQGGPIQVNKKVVTQQRLFDVLPRQVKMGLEEFHLDAGWQWHDGDWQIAPDRFPGGWAALRDFNRENGLTFHLWMNDGAADSPEFLLDLIEKSDIGRLFMDRRVNETTIAGLEKVRAKHPAFSTSCHNSTSRSAYWPWGNVHFLSDFNQIYFGEGQFWAWSNILPEAKIAPKNDPLFPQRTQAERFFSRHDIYAGDLITRSAAYQAEWVWPFNCIIPPHNGWIWFENRPIKQLRDRIYTYLASRFHYQWGFDPKMLTREAIDLHLACTAWFKANRAYLTTYQHVLDPPDGKGIDAAGHLVNGRGFIFLFNPSDQARDVTWQEILWEPDLELSGKAVSLSDWTAMTGFKPLGAQKLAKPGGGIRVGPRDVRVLGVNLDDAAVLARVREERSRISYP